MTGDPALRDASLKEARALSAGASKGEPSEGCAMVRGTMKRLLRVGQIGELAGLREEAKVAAKP